MSLTWGKYESDNVHGRVQSFLDHLDRRQPDDVQYRVDGGKVVALLMMVGICVFFWIGVVAVIMYTLG